MHKQALFSAVVLLMVLTIVTFGTLACGSKTTEIKPAQVVSADIYTVSGNATDVVVQGNFTVMNPNAVQVTLTSFEYSLAVGNMSFAYLQLGRDLNIGAGKEISLSGPVDINFGNLVGNAMIGQALSQGGAVQLILPYWKKIGGQNPAAPLQPLWDSLSAGVTWTPRGTIIVEYGGQLVTGNFTESITK